MEPELTRHKLSSSFLQPMVKNLSGRATPPLRVIIELTNACNQSCDYCFSVARSPEQIRHLTIASLIDVIRHCDQIGVFDITLTGGEPLYWPGLPLLAKELPPRHFSALQIATNASNTSSTILNAIQKLAPDRLRFSFDGPEQLHDRYRGCGSFQATHQGCLQLAPLGRTSEIATVIHQHNWQNWSYLIHLAEELSIDQIELTPAQLPPEHGIKKLSIDQLKLLQYQLAQLKTNRIRLDLSHLATQHQPALPTSISQFVNQWLPGFTILVRTNGDVFRSLPHSKNPSKKSMVVIGNLNHQSFDKCLAQQSVYLTNQPTHHGLSLPIPKCFEQTQASMKETQPMPSRRWYTNEFTIAFDILTFCLQ